jgi:hypothetical protein
MHKKYSGTETLSRSRKQGQDASVVLLIDLRLRTRQKAVVAMVVKTSSSCQYEENSKEA